MNIPLTPELDTRLREEAARLGVAPDDFVLGMLRRELPPGESRVESMNGSLDADESRLLAEINRGFDERQWSRYHHLVGKRQQNTITGKELCELTSMSDQVEQLNVPRVEVLTELAKLRHTTLPGIMKQLQITPPPVL